MITGLSELVSSVLAAKSAVDQSALHQQRMQSVAAMDDFVRQRAANHAARTSSEPRVVGVNGAWLPVIDGESRVPKVNRG